MNRLVAVVIAPPYGGKDTQADLLVEKGYVKVSTSLLAQNSLLPGEAELMAQGKPFSDERAYNLLDSRMKELEDHDKVVVVGFPRSAVQAEMAVKCFKEQGRVPFFIFLDVPDFICMSRFNENGPRVTDSGVVRKDDEKVILVERLSIYRKNLVGINRVIHSVCPDSSISVSGSKKPEVIHNNILDNIDSKFRDYRDLGIKGVSCLVMI